MINAIGKMDINKKINAPDIINKILKMHAKGIEQMTNRHSIRYCHLPFWWFAESFFIDLKCSL